MLFRTFRPSTLCALLSSRWTCTACPMHAMPVSRAQLIPACKPSSITGHLWTQGRRTSNLHPLMASLWKHDQISHGHRFICDRMPRPSGDLPLLLQSRRRCSVCPLRDTISRRQSDLLFSLRQTLFKWQDNGTP